MTVVTNLPYPCVVFDLDGTLLDTRQAMVATINRLLGELGRRTVGIDQVGHATHQGLTAMLHAALAETGQMPAPTILQQLERLLRERHLETAASSVRCFHGARELIEMLRERGAWLAICSNQDETSVRRLLAIFGLLGHFCEIVGGDTLPSRKPDPLPLRWLMDAARCAPDSTLMVGDSEVDAECAARSGTAMVLMTHGYGGDSIPMPHLAMPDFASLRRLLLPSPAACDPSRKLMILS